MADELLTVVETEYLSGASFPSVADWAGPAAGTVLASAVSVGSKALICAFTGHNATYRN